MTDNTCENPPPQPADKTFSSHTKYSLCPCPFVVCFALCSQHQPTTDLQITLYFLVFYINGIMYVLCSVLHTQHNNTEIHPYCCMYRSLFLLLLSSIIWIYYILLIQSPVYGHLDCFHFGAIVNKATIILIVGFTQTQCFVSLVCPTFFH